MTTQLSRTARAAMAWQSKMGRKSFATLNVLRRHGPGTTQSAINNRAARLARIVKA